jgi:hypothetical protein
MADLIAGIKERVEHHRRKLAFWEKALKEAEEESNPQSQRTSRLTSTAIPGRNGTAESFGGFRTRWEYVQDLMRRHPTGLTPAEIRSEAKKEGVSLVGSFPYEQLKKLENEVRKSAAGKYYPAKTISPTESH